MAFERQGLLLPPRTEPAIDEQVHVKLQEITEGPATYEQLTLPPDVLVAKEAEFVESGYSANVDLSVAHVDETATNRRIGRLHLLSKEIAADGTLPDEIKAIYQWRIQEESANAMMLLASANKDQALFNLMNQDIYGRPDEVLYMAALDSVCAEAELLLQSDKPNVKKAAYKVLEEFGNKRGYRELLSPDSEIFKLVRDNHFRPHGHYALMLAGVTLPEGEKVTPEAGDPALLHILQNTLGSDYGLIDATAVTWAMSHSRRGLIRPAAYNMPYNRFVGLGIGHEISHLLEMINGGRGPIRLAESGLDGYEAGNEGRSVIREQVMYPNIEQFQKLPRWRDILRRHIAISTGVGVGQDRSQTFAEIYETMNIIDTMYQTKLTPDDPEQIRQKAHGKTWSLLTRVLRGCDGTAGAYLKDKIYLEGNVACWLAAAERGEEAISEGDLGKFDINNPKHIEILTQHALLPVR